MQGSHTGFRLTQGVYYLALGAWFGAIVMLAVAAGITFATVRGYEFTLEATPDGTPVLAERAEAILAGGIVGNVLTGLTVIQGLCAGAAVICLLLQHGLWRDRLAGVRQWANVARVALVAGPIVLLVLNLAVIGPGIYELRPALYEPGLSEAQREQVQARFDRYHDWSERTTGLAGLMLAGAVLVSPFAFRREDVTD